MFKHKHSHCTKELNYGPVTLSITYHLVYCINKTVYIRRGRSKTSLPMSKQHNKPGSDNDDDNKEDDGDNDYYNHDNNNYNKIIMKKKVIELIISISKLLISHLVHYHLLLHHSFDVLIHAQAQCLGYTGNSCHLK